MNLLQYLEEYPFLDGVIGLMLNAKSGDLQFLACIDFPEEAPEQIPKNSRILSILNCTKTLAKFRSLSEEALFQRYVGCILDSFILILPHQLSQYPDLSIVFENMDQILECMTHFGSFRALSFLSQILSIDNLEIDDEVLVQFAEQLIQLDVKGPNDGLMFTRVFSKILERNPETVKSVDESLPSMIFGFASTAPPDNNHQAEHELNYEVAKFISILFSSETALDNQEAFLKLQAMVNFPAFIVLADSMDSKDNVIAFRALAALLGPSLISAAHFWDEIERGTLETMIFDSLTDGSIQAKLYALKLLVKVTEIGDQNFMALVMRESDQIEFTVALDNILSLGDVELQYQAIVAVNTIINLESLIFARQKERFANMLAESEAFQRLEEIVDDLEKPEELRDLATQLCAAIQTFSTAVEI